MINIIITNIQTERHAFRLKDKIYIYIFFSYFPYQINLTLYSTLSTLLSLPYRRQSHYDATCTYLHLIIAKQKKALYYD
jgi:hypothetical protein